EQVAVLGEHLDAGRRRALERLPRRVSAGAQGRADDADRAQLVGVGPGVGHRFHIPCAQPMPDADLVTRAAEANAASFVAIAAASAGGRTLELPGVRAIATPAAPERPLFNAAFELEPGALA